MVSNMVAPASRICAIARSESPGCMSTTRDGIAEDGAAPDHVPAPLLAQLKPGGRLVVPVGPVSAVQELQLIEKDNAGRTRTTRVAPVRFVPLVRPR